MADRSLRDIALQLFDIGALQFGSFKLKSGQISPFYVDLRLTLSYPQLLAQLGAALWEKIRLCRFDLLCGVPYAALPYATAISLQHGVPMIMVRKEAKEYGTKKRIEGVFTRGQHTLVIEDVVTLGESVLETVKHLQESDLIVHDVVVIVDREQGARHNLKEQGLALHTVFTIEQLLILLLQEKRIDEEVREKVLTFIHAR